MILKYDLIPLINEGIHRMGYGLILSSINISVDEGNKVIKIKGLSPYEKLKSFLQDYIIKVIK